MRQRIPIALYDAAGVRELDRLATAKHGIASGTLMERAGATAFAWLRRRYPRACAIAVVCGPGNNGGDGFVLARLAKAAGLAVTVMSPGERNRANGDAREARCRWEQSGGVIADVSPDALSGADVVVDALFGTGLARTLDEPWRSLIEAVNHAARQVVALDLPSGLHADTGRVLGAAIRAHTTVCFIALKKGLVTGEAVDYTGAILLDDLSLPPALFTSVPPAAHRLAPEVLCAVLPRRPRNLHKGDAGRVLIVGGDRGMSGAARLAGEAAYRAGAGLVTLATHPEHAAHVASARPEMIAHAVDAEEVRRLLERADVVALGPGLGRDAWAQRVWRAAIDSAHSMVVDADGLNLLAAQPRHRDHWVLTPHPGEAARLLATSVASIEEDRFEAARTIAERYGGVCVLKGAGTVLAEKHRPPWVCTEGNPGMASGGMGDALTGVIAALLAQGLTPLDAARLGVFVHARAGDAAARAGGEIGLLARDLMPHLRVELNRLTRC